MKKHLMALTALIAVVLNVYAQQDTAKVKIKKKDTVYRSLPSPLPDPPFPTSDWDDAPLVGTDAEAPNYPLTKLLGLTKSSVKIYGWVDIGANLSSSKNSNAPTSYNIIPNTVVLDQAGIKFDKQPDMAQTDHFDWGFCQQQSMEPTTGIQQVKAILAISYLVKIINRNLTLLKLTYCCTGRKLQMGWC